MVGSKLAIATLKTTLSTLLILGVGLGTKDGVAQISSPEDVVQHPKGIVAREEKCPHRHNSKPANSCSESIINLPAQRAREMNLSTYSESYPLTDHPRSDWEVEAASQDWLNLNHGEGVKDIVRFVIWRF